MCCKIPACLQPSLEAALPWIPDGWLNNQTCSFQAKLPIQPEKAKGLQVMQPCGFWILLSSHFELSLEILDSQHFEERQQYS